MSTTEEASAVYTNGDGPYGGYHKNTIPAHDPELTETDAGNAHGRVHAALLAPGVYVRRADRHAPVHQDTRRGAGRVPRQERQDRRSSCPLRPPRRIPRVRPGAGTRDHVLLSRLGVRRGWPLPGDPRAPTGEEKDGAEFAARIWQGAYKAIERDGLVFAYMGPREEEPPFPEWEGNFTLEGDDELAAYSNFQTCNWLQVQDNAADQYHHIPLHTTAVVPGHEQGTTFGEAGAAPYLIRPDLQFFPVHDGRGMAWTSSRRVDSEKIFIRVNHQCLPNLSFHSYLFEDGSATKYFTRLHMIRWTVPVDDTNSIMFGWRVIGSTHRSPRHRQEAHGGLREHGLPRRPGRHAPPRARDLRSG